MILIIIDALGTVHRGTEFFSIPLCTVPSALITIGGIGNERKNRDDPDYRIGIIAKNTQKCLEDLRRFVVTQTPVKDHQLTLM